MQHVQIAPNKMEEVTRSIAHRRLISKKKKKRTPSVASRRPPRAQLPRLRHCLTPTASCAPQPALPRRRGSANPPTPPPRSTKHPYRLGCTRRLAAFRGRALRKGSSFHLPLLGWREALRDPSDMGEEAEQSDQSVLASPTPPTPVARQVRAGEESPHRSHAPPLLLHRCLRAPSTPYSPPAALAIVLSAAAAASTRRRSWEQHQHQHPASDRCHAVLLSSSPPVWCWSAG
ncbi:hypothetical protein PVAP13_6KG344424 [Panicum virgatum]|uniref:Uncharacterized protein n=1 Tax=Panicum virgatum TaxID=38727 RepID=A0A8T0RIG5_PANVG|nr:hypothetical protein PVAP13_6KG344424 [Panicum virgatum]